MDALGVSATHLDHTMVPYVRKSFWKHYRDGLKYVSKDDKWEEHIIAKPFAGTTSIEDKIAYGDKEAYEYAMDMTVKEVYQAVEGMYHNLKILGRLNSNVKNIAA